MVHKKSVRKSSGPKKSEHESSDKKAKKALAHAETSVRAAQKAVKTSSKKLRKRASALSEQIERLAAHHANALHQLEVATKEAPSVEVAALTPPLPKPQPAAPTLIQLRQQAREQKVTGYSRLNKAGLMAALDSARQR